MNKLKYVTTRILPLFLIITYTLLVTACYSWYESKVPMTVSTETLDDLFDDSVEVLELAAPSQLFVSQGEDSGTIKLSWSASDNATSYRIEKAIVIPAEDGTFELPSDDVYEILQEFVYDTSYTDEILKNPSYNNEEYNYLYFYRLSSDNIRKGLESSSFSNFTKDLVPLEDEEGNPTTKYTKDAITASCGCGWLLPAPTGIDAWKGKSTTEIKITWQPVPNARYYKIYRGVNENGTSMEQIDTVLGNQTNYVNTMVESEQGTEFYYKVSAQLSTGVDSAFSALALGYSLKPGAPETPENVKTVNSLGENTSSIIVNWDAVNYVPTKATLTLSYSLYRTSSVDSVYSLVKNGIDPGVTTYTDSTGLKNGIYYYYYVQAIATDSATGEKIKSAFSESGPDETETPAMGFLLSYPNNIEVVSGSSGNLNIRWTAAIGSELSGHDYKYSIYASDNQDGPYTILNEKVEGSLASDNYYEYEVSKKPFFKISTFYESLSLESELSFAVAPCPDAPTGVKVTKNEQLSHGDFVANSLGVYPVKITWSKPSTDNPAGYHVYRATAADGEFRKVTTAPVQELSYIDKNETAKACSIYYYKVVSVNILGQGKYGNDPSGDSNARGYGMLTPTQFFREYNKTVMNSQKKLTYMNKANDMEKLGTETINGDISGTLYYTAGKSGYVTMKYTDYCDFYINDDSSLGKLFIVDGNTDTEIEGNLLSKNGHMKKSVELTGMYRGTITYDNVVIKTGAAGDGYYTTTTKDSAGNVVEDSYAVDWKIGEEGRK